MLTNQCGTQDESKVEAQAVILRYMEDRQTGLWPVGKVVDVFTTGDTKGEILCNEIVATLDA